MRGSHRGCCTHRQLLFAAPIGVQLLCVSRHMRAVSQKAARLSWRAVGLRLRPCCRIQASLIVAQQTEASNKHTFGFQKVAARSGPCLGNMERPVEEQQRLCVLGHVKSALHPCILCLDQPESFSLMFVGFLNHTA